MAETQNVQVSTVQVPSIGGLAEASRKRKEKLLALRQKSGTKAVEDNEAKEPEEIEQESAPPPPKKIIKFRNYAPKDETLKEKKIPDTKPQSVEEDVKEHLEKAKSETVVDEVGLTNLAPRKPDWDLKRDVSKKLEKLQRRTQRAIVELIRERLRGNTEELASAVNAMTEGTS